MSSRGLNKVMLIGRLGADPETRHMPNGNAVTNIRVATSETWKDKNTGDQKEKTEWHSIVCFQKLAEIVAEYARKGSQVYVEGKLCTRKWQDKEGKDRYTTEINADTVQLLGSRNDSGSSSPGRDANSDAGQSKQRPAQAASRPAAPPVDDGGFDDDIPF